MIPEPYRTRLKQAVGDTKSIDAIRTEAMLEHPHLFQPFRCAECIVGTTTESGLILCRGMTLAADNTAHCGAYKARRQS